MSTAPATPDSATPPAAVSLHARVEGYLGLRRALGYTLRPTEPVLVDFADYAAAHGLSTVTGRAALAWVSNPRWSAATTARRLSMLRLFAGYLQAFDPGCEIPGDAGLPHVAPRRIPHLYTAEQVDALREATLALRPPLWALTMGTLIGLMAATGLRTGEAWRLDDSDVDHEHGLLLIRCSKYGRTRQIPLHPSTVTALAAYQGARDELCPAPEGPALLLDPTGRRLHGVRPSVTFGRLLAETGISAPAGQPRPRLHNLRHSFAVATLRDWHAQGLDVEPRLAVLSTYLGHVNPAHTYWYFQAVPDLMAVLVERTEQHDDNQHEHHDGVR